MTITTMTIKTITIAIVILLYWAMVMTIISTYIVKNRPVLCLDMVI